MHMNYLLLANKKDGKTMSTRDPKKKRKGLLGEEEIREMICMLSKSD